MDAARDVQNWPGAASAGLRILAVDPQNEAAQGKLLSLVEFHANTHDWPAMVELCDQILELNPNVEDAKSFLLLAPEEDISTSAEDLKSRPPKPTYQPSRPSGDAIKDAPNRNAWLSRVNAWIWWPFDPSKPSKWMGPTLLGVIMILIGSVGWLWMQNQLDEYQDARAAVFGLGGVIIDVADAFDDSVDFDQAITYRKIARNVSGGVAVAGSILWGFGVLKELRVI